MSRVISDARQQVVRAAQLGDVIISRKVPAFTVSPSFTVILNLTTGNISITLNSANSHATQNANVGASKTPGLTRTAAFDPGSNIAASVTISPAVASVDSGGSFPTVHPPDFEKILSTVGTFNELDAFPEFDVT